jgi:hypothetical protein
MHTLQADDFRLIMENDHRESAFTCVPKGHACAVRVCLACVAVGANSTQDGSLQWTCCGGGGAASWARGAGRPG